ncbi:Leucine efflux protein [Arthrobacter sp. Bi83]|uniref:LysE family translocator n=1 Tax=Arthrobacter sp. Bi83 TaxID=2822353 RepID=UPI001E033804|nr:LysE family translocator [Arthrobacter sp. Bi83]CAH0201227.1 Leucine efflux protein [Arthrobacter sp. Bi83]
MRSVSTGNTGTEVTNRPKLRAGALARYVFAVTLVRSADGGAVVAIVLLAHSRGIPGWLAGLLGASITAPRLLGPFIARTLDTARDGRKVIAGSAVLHGLLLGAAALLMPAGAFWPAVLLTPMTAVLSFALVAGLLTLLPGLDTALVLRSSISKSRSFAFATALGINTGAMIWGIAAAVGVSALLAASELAYRMLTLAGAAYMIWLGASLLWTCLRKTNEPDIPANEAPALITGKDDLFRGWLTGTGTNLLNPKVGVFYIAAIPQFIPSDTSPLLMGILLAGFHCLLAMAWFTLLIIGAGYAARWLKGAKSIRIIAGITGTVLVGFGLKLALQPAH